MSIIQSLQDLLIHNIKTLYDAEHQLTEIIPLINERASHPNLKRIISEELEAAKTLSAVLKDAASQMAEEPAGQISESMMGLTREIRYFFNEEFDDDTVDAAILSLVQQTCHYFIAAYGATSQYAQTKDLPEVKSLLGKNIEHKKKLDEKLKTLAMHLNNIATSD